MTLQPRTPEAESLRTFLLSAFDVKVGVGIAAPKKVQPPLYPIEAAHVAKATRKRRLEFAAGRAAARAALAELGRAAAPLPASPDRSPVWPLGTYGSISHTDRLCAAVATTSRIGIGIDLEDAHPLAEDIMPMICTDKEQEMIRGPESARLAKLIFSAKEAAYKAQYPVSKTLIGFDCLQVTLNLVSQAFEAQFLRAVPGFCMGDTLHGRYAWIGDHVVSTAHCAVKEG
ncbi:MAG: 4'-phosphopantetheinyl transferase superfamily protein [Pseudomonadota bacterium]